jgi:hypothetical protein
MLKKEPSVVHRSKPAKQNQSLAVGGCYYEDTFPAPCWISVSAKLSKAMTTDYLAEAAVLAAIFLIAAGICKLVDLYDRYSTRRRVYRETDKTIGEGPTRKWLTHLFRFACSYGLYVGCAFIFVAKSKIDLLWLIGLVVAVAATYLWNQLAPVDK